MDSVTKISGGALPAVVHAATGLGPRSTGHGAKVGPEPTRSEPTASTELTQAVDRLNHELAQVSPKVTFVLLPDLGRMVVRVVNSETNEILRQIPPEEFLHLVQQLDKLEGLLADETA